MKLNINRISRNLLFGLFAIYFAQGSFYETGSIISQTLLFLILSISIIFFFKTIFLKDSKSMFFKLWTLLMMLNVIGYLLTLDYSNRYYSNLIKNILTCMLSFYPFYYFAKNGHLKRIHLTSFLFIMLPIAILQFGITETNIMKLYNRESENVVNNISYSPQFFIFSSDCINSK